MEKDEGDGMEKGKVDRSHYLFDNKALRALILPLVVEQLLAVLVGMAELTSWSRMSEKSEFPAFLWLITLWCCLSTYLLRWQPEAR